MSRRQTGRPKLGRRQVRQRLKARNQTTVTRSEIRSSGIGHVAEPPPSIEQEQSERWLEGDRDPEEYPGGWKQVF